MPFRWRRGLDSSDTVEQNNVYHAYLNIPLLENILILESRSGEADTLKSILGEAHTVQVLNIHTDADLIPGNVRELSAYEEVFLVNLSNADLTAETMPENFVQTLYDYVYNIGGGLFTWRAPCFSRCCRCRWSNTPLRLR